MGINGLTTYIRDNFEGLLKSKEIKKGSTLIIDAYGFLFTLVRSDKRYVL